MPRLPVPDAPILVVGDIMCDHYVWGEVERISPEAPVQVLRWEREADKPGGAANAALNLAALGCGVRLAGVVGADDKGRWLIGSLKKAGVDTRGVVLARDRSTTVKTRVMARGQHMLRIDREVRHPLHPGDERRLVRSIELLRRGAAAIVCSDYDKGVLTSRVVRSVIAGRPKALVVIDPKGKDFAKYRGADLLTPNEKELSEAAPSGGSLDDDAAIRRKAVVLMRKHQLRALLVTRGARGMDLFERDGRTLRRTHIPALQRHEVFDVTGAGDTVAAVVTMAAASGLPLADAARIANAAAGIVVGMVGTAVADAGALTRMIDGGATQAASKVLPRRAAAARIADARAQGSTVVFTSGTFESLDAGHLRALQNARARGDLLVVGIGGDSGTVTRRAEMLAALRFVDLVTVYSERTPGRLVRELRPNLVIY